MSWLTAAEIIDAGLPGLPGDKGALSRHIQRHCWRTSPLAREGERGWEYQVALLPAEAQRALAVRAAHAEASVQASETWANYEALPDKTKAEAQRRLGVMDQISLLKAGGMTASTAVALVSRRAGVSASTLWGWCRLVDGIKRQDWLPALAPKHRGRTSKVDCDPRAWDFLVSLYLRPERPLFASVHRRLVEAASKHGWGPIPSAKTLHRRLDALPKTVMVLARDGRDALERMYPHQTRDTSTFAVMAAVNADGHTFDVFCRFEDGTISRPVMVGVQDLASGMVLGWRIGQSENWTLVRHAFADAIGRFGIPQDVWLDNGRAFASKWLTGGQKTRFRFTIRDDEPSGILTQLGITVHWTTPYHGQAKPIERAWRDLAEEISKHPALAGAYTGNKIDAKPENYGSRAVPIEQFRALVHSEIVRHNARPGRNGRGMRGRSFAEVFAEGFERDPGSVIATAAQRRLLLTAAEGVTCRAPTGEVQLGGNRYWHEALTDQIGKKVIVRFDPDDLHAAVGIYARDGRLICEAECIEASGFDDMAAAQDHARRKRTFVKSQRQLLDMERRLGIAEVAGLLPRIAAANDPAPRLEIQKSRKPESKTRPVDVDRAEASFGRAVRSLAGE